MQSVFRIGIIVCLFGARSFADAGATPDQLRFFETSIRPLLIEKCHGCHGAEKQWGSLRLDSHEAILKGGDTGPAAVPGKPAESLLIKAVLRTSDDLKMPPKEALTERQIADLTRWIEMGIPYTAAVPTAKSRHRDPNHWSFQPVVAAPTPSTQETSWSNNRWDQFILARLEAAAITPALIANPRTLLRRVTFDLIGLPPTPDEMTEFLSDDRPDAYARLLDRLLASPSYGERWGRHWLDIARYADSNGLDENVAHGNAWRYRDYVVSSFNNDQPFDLFLTEQLAGDLLPAADDATRSRQLTATGFLALGPKVLAEVDETKMQMDIIDEQIDTVGRALLAQTLGCARCHDHKFDPIETADYYGLAGIFKSTRTMEHFKKVARWHENPLPTAEAYRLKADFESRIAQKKETIKSVVDTANRAIQSSNNAGDSNPAGLEEKYPDEVKAQLKRLREELAQLEKSPPELPSAMGVSEEKVVDVAVHIRGNHLKLGDVVGRRVPRVMGRQAEPRFGPNQSGRMELAQWLVDPYHPLTGRVFVNRVWRWHFGRGLVRSPDNFGVLGELPTHPELLDALTSAFIRGGWSIKPLHRQILESKTYQLESSVDSTFVDHDPENRLYARAEIHRLEAESIRDALIAVGDGIDRTIGGSLLAVKNRAYFFDHTSKDLTDYHSQRRSLYLPIVRNNVYDVFQLLDYPDAAVPNGDRATTTIAPQALLMMNSEFVSKCSADLAEKLLSQPSDSDTSRIQTAYARAYGREATDSELASSLTFLRQLDQALASTEPENVRRRKSWESLCHVIVSSNEFIYIR